MTAQVTPLLRCEGLGHGDRTLAVGHDSGPARYRVRSLCPDCDFTTVRVYCAGRVDWQVSSGAELRCQQCGTVHAVPEMWIEITSLSEDANAWHDDDAPRLADATSTPPIAPMTDVSRTAVVPVEVAEPTHVDLDMGVSATGRGELNPSLEWADAIGQFLAHLSRSGAPKPTRTLRSYHLRRFAVDSTATPWAIEYQDLLNHIDRHAWSTSTRKTFRSTMREFYRWAIDNGYTNTNPADRLPRVRVASGAPRPAADAALHDALAVADLRTSLMLRLAAQAGLRCREIALTHRDDISHDQIGWSLLVHGKGERERTVPLPDDLARDLLDFASETGWVFPGQVDGHLSAHYVSKLIARVLPGATAHQLRHRYATRAYQLGGRDILAVQHLLGHASPTTTQIYTGVESEAIRRASREAARDT